MILQLIAGVTAGAILGLLLVFTILWQMRVVILKHYGRNLLMSGMAYTSPIVRSVIMLEMLKHWCPDCGGAVHPEEHPEKPEEKPS
jgi:hypothetical protein